VLRTSEAIFEIRDFPRDLKHDHTIGGFLKHPISNRRLVVQSRRQKEDRSRADSLVGWKFGVRPTGNCGKVRVASSACTAVGFRTKCAYIR
jgi:hypothetical protein